MSKPQLMKMAPAEADLEDLVSDQIYINPRLIPKDTADIRFIENREDMDRLYEEAMAEE